MKEDMEMQFKMFEVGGCIRDAILGLDSKDIDFTVVIQNAPSGMTLSEGFQAMKSHLVAEGFTIWLETPAMVTIRAKFPKGHPQEKLTADFVLARKDLGMVPGTRQSIVVLGTLFDDLQRRDFTLNALAKDCETGEIVDFFDGMEDLDDGVLKTPIDPMKTFLDDPLRMLRGFRFTVTKGFTLGAMELKACKNPELADAFIQKVSIERAQVEIEKMFRADVGKTLDVMNWFRENQPQIFNHIFSRMWLKPTLEQK